MSKKINNIKQFIKKYDELFFLIIFSVIIFGVTVYISTGVEDELWNFQNVYKMFKGYKIYIDANVITTPLFHTIGLILFKIFGANFFVFKLYGVSINIFLFFGVYYIFKSFKIPNNMVKFLTIMFFLAEINVCHNTSNYNNLCMLFVVYGILSIISRDRFSNTKFIILQSLIIFLILLTKQNIGILYFISFSIYNFLFEKNYKIKNIVNTIIMNLILIFVFILVMNKLELLEGFVSYAILGIKEFAVKNVAIEKPVIKLIGITIITAIIIFIFNYKKLVKENVLDNINKISCFAFPFLIISYPIFNVAHIDLALFLIYILLIYIIYLVFDNFDINMGLVNKINIYILSLLVFISLIRIGLYINKTIKYEYSNLYFGCILEDEIKDKIDYITKYINKSEDKVIIFSAEAAFYMMPLNISNGSFDEPLLGNFGKNGEIGIIKEIFEMQNTQILIKKQKLVYQESDLVIDYIKENLIYSGEIYDFMIYKTEK